MRVIGVIAEFNPFHNGHEYLIRKAKELTGDPRAMVLVVMSGPFTQRGLPSVLPKHLRARQALLCGADVVIELPFSFACAPSERFAFGAVELLYRTGVVTDIAFGTDTDNIALLKSLSEMDFDNDEEYISILKDNLSSGMSFPAARADAICKVTDSGSEEELRNALRRPNSILALDYLRAVKKLKKNFNIIAIPRVGEEYDSSSLDSDYPSATAIRDAIYSCGNSPSGVATKLCSLMPDKSLAAMLAALSSREFQFPDLDLYSKMILTSLPSEDPHTAYIGDSLYGHIMNTCDKLRSSDTDFKSLTKALNTKHFTDGRILRAIASLMVGQDEEFIKSHGHVPYIRVLGFSRDGRYCLKIMGKCAKVPIMHNCSDFLETQDSEVKDVFEKDQKAQNIQDLLMGRALNGDWDIPPVSVK